MTTHAQVEVRLDYTRENNGGAHDTLLGTTRQDYTSHYLFKVDMTRQDMLNLAFQNL